MILKELIRFVGQLFEKYHVRYFTFGAVGMGLWIEARATKDLDIVLTPVGKGFLRSCMELKKNGVELTSSLQRKLREGRTIKVPVRGRITRLDMKKIETDFDRSALKRSKQIKTPDLTLRTATPEDIILYKLISFRPQDIADIIRIRKEYRQLDTAYISSWIPKLRQKTSLPILNRWKEAA
ncbi:MAG: hypothetical protein HY606_13445 [Planctomycetes bacterium]|nr:hypothetical protein [Planctomycetota bacterium]